MQDDLDAVVAAGKRLVDRVVDHLVDEVMEAAGTRRADVHARAQPHRLEALENGDVLGGIGSFSHQKSPAKGPESNLSKSTRRSGRQRRFRGSTHPLSQRFYADFRRLSRRRGYLRLRGPQPRARAVV